MKQYNRYALLFNQLWLANSAVIGEIDSNLDIGVNWDDMAANKNINKKTTGEIMQDGVASLLSKLGSKIKQQDEDLDKVSKRVRPALFNSQPNKTYNSSLNTKDRINSVNNIEDDNDINVNNHVTKINNLPNNSISNTGNMGNDWDSLINDAATCTKCALCNGRTYAVIERGSRSAKWMFVGEFPNDVENAVGIPFVGASGELLDKMIAAMKLDINKDVYICNAIKCMPPANRNPELSEIETCRQHLLSQIAHVKPTIIIALGRFASQALLNTDLAVAKLRGSVKFCNSIPVIVTYPPAYLLRNTEAKKEAWVDLQLAMQVFKQY
jgi:DNA polymerase